MASKIPRAGEIQIGRNQKFSTSTFVDFDFTTLAELQIKSCENNKDKPAFGTRVGKKYEWMTYAQFGKEVENFRKVLVHHNIGTNDSIAIISNNRVEWAVAMYAVVSLGGQLVPMYEAQLEKDWWRKLIRLW